MLRSRALRLVVAAALAAAAAPASAQEDAADRRAIATDVERLRNNVFFADQTDRVRELVRKLLDRRSPTADGELRRLLLDPAAHPNIVEQIAWVTLTSPPHALLDDVVERLRTESPGAPAERRLDAALLRSPPDVVRGLARVAADTGRGAASRRTALRLLGRTGDGLALEPLADAWSGPEAELREAARAAFDDLAPGAAATAAEAHSFIESLRREDIPLAEALRRILRERVRQQRSTPSRAVTAQDYSELALALLPRVGLDELLRLFVLGSPVPDVRAAAVQRVAAFPFDDAGDADARVRAARALFEALRREDTAAVEQSILRALAALSPAIRGGVGPEEMDGLLARIRPGGATTRDSRILAAKLAGLLRDERATPAIEAAFAWFGDADDEARIALLDALQDIPADRAEWLAGRVRAERRPRVLRKLVVMLSRSTSPATVPAFAEILGDPLRSDAESRVEAVKALAAVWAVRSDPSAREALLRRGLTDPDAAVRAAAAGSLGIPGPGASDAVIEGLLRAVRDAGDAEVRRAAARSVIALDEPRALGLLLDRIRDDPAVFEVWTRYCTDAMRRDQSPDRPIAAADALVAADLRPLAIQVLSDAEAAGLDAPRGRARLREALGRALLDAGRWEESERIARSMLAGADARDDGARMRADVLIARALVASREAGRLVEAERRLTGVRASAAIDGVLAAECAVALGDLRLLQGDAIGAIEALAVETKDAPETLRRRVAMLRTDTEKQAESQRRDVLAWIDELAGAGREAAVAKVRTPAFRTAAAWHLSRELDRRPDAATARRLLDAASVVTGTEFPKPADGESADRIAEVVRAAREELAKARRAEAPPR